MSIEALKQIWPEWQIEGRPLGKGSFGVVYKAVRRDHGVESYAAIKVISIPTDSFEVDSLRSEGLDMNATRTYLQGIVNDFVSEIQLMESLKGVQNIVSVEDYKVVEKIGEIGWHIYIRMELLTSFNAYTCDKKLTEEEIIKLGCDICTALEICAKRNIIHRDIKPENIFINDFGDFKLGDFGIARKLENMTGGLSQKGTFNYMAPEVINSSEYDARVDIYSLGIVLYRLLNGNRLPFLDTEKQILNPNERRNAVDRRLRGEELPAPCDASPAMSDLILRACAFDPNLRFASATEMKQALLSVSNGTYQLSVTNNLDKTISVCRAPTNYDGTTTVRKVSVADQKSNLVVGTFGAPCRKRSSFFKSVSSILKKRDDCEATMPINPEQTAYPQGGGFSNSGNLDYEKDNWSIAENQTFACSPWEIFMQTYKVGDTTTVRIRKLVQFGAFAEIIPGVDGFIHNSEIHNLLNRSLSENEIVNVQIISVDKEKKRVSLSIPALPTARACSEKPINEIYSANKQKANTAVTELSCTSTQCKSASHVPLIAQKTISTDTKELLLNQCRLSANDIQTLSQCIHLKNLNLSAIRIVDDKAVEGLTKSIGLHLIVLDLRALSDLTDLSILDISFNYLDNIDILSNLNNLTTLILHHNRLRNVSILNKLAGLFELDLSYNMLTDISELSGLTELTTLELSFNNITDISSLRYLHKLTKLNITSNKISDLSPLSNLHHLTELHLQFNPICDISFLLEMKNLKYLSIGIHALDNISVMCGLTHLKNLSLWCEDWAKKDIYKQKYKEKIDALQRALPKCCIEID